ncbi:MAG TPA: cysteine rich repeat-containing protein [Myxococcaceae bacterium]|nr:cysteine rich repeat-containing protein [Myxococcaceae bacterium]
MRRLVPSPAVLLVMLAGLGASAALAQQASAPARPCAADVARLCPGVQPGHGAMRQCLQQNADQLSAECKAHIEQARQHFRAVHEACQGDVAAFCANVTPGAGRIAACLREHASELSDTCKAHWPAQKP